MPRVTRGFKARRRRKKVMKLAKGYRGGRHRLYKTATEAVDRALCYAYRDRRTRKRDFRSLWIVRIAAAAKQNGISYSKLMGSLKKANVELDRKVLSNMAILDANAFSQVVKLAVS
ncbi:MAG: 50S ribosomal protein L20 [Desulfobulbaceae bacterium]|nr:50S ribosomal protein L20 [Desulfobulbaceae bacterium]MCK5404382.1 50S ribosomal protein L20 [Desulfobulbaceae bacterium]